MLLKSNNKRSELSSKPITEGRHTKSSYLNVPKLSNLKLAQKESILVSVLLLFELFFIVWFHALFEEAATQARAEAHSNKVISAASLLSLRFYDAGAALFSYRFTRSKASYDRYEQAIGEISDEFRNLSDLVTNDTQQQIHITRLSPLIKQAMNFFVRYREDYSDIPASQLLQMKHLRYEFAGTLNAIVAELKAMQKEEQGRHTRLGELEEERQRSIVQSLWIGLGVNVTAALLFAWFLTSATTTRLKILMDNNYRLAQRRDLHPKLDGSDEITQLDHTFHDMAVALKEAERLKQEFVTLLSHELRTPLTGIQGTLALVERGIYGQLNEQGRNRVIAAEQNVYHLIQLINELLELEKLKAGKFDLNLEQIEPNQLVKKASEIVSGFADLKRITIDATIGDISGLTIKGDKNRLVQVLVNLLSNAIKFSPESSVVSIEAGPRGNMFEFRIQDQGPGIPDHFKSIVFEQFEQAYPQRLQEMRGTGLGLAICKEIISGHGGLIGFESNEGTGTIIWFQLPILN